MRHFAPIFACVLPIVFFSPSTSPCAEPRALRLATWNLAWLDSRPGHGEIPRAENDYARLRLYAAQLQADVVALQEVDGPGAAARVFDSEAWSFHFAADPGDPQRCGFAWRKEISARPHPDLALGRRPAADLEVKIGPKTLRLLSVHLKSGCPDPDQGARDDDPDCPVLFAQIPILEGWIDARAREDVPFAVLGDFNRRVQPGDPIWEAIDDADPPGADLSDPFERRSPVCWGGRWKRYIDKILLGRETAAWLDPVSPRERPYDAADRRAEKVLSDHCPLVLTLAPGAPPSAPPRIASAAAADHLGRIVTACGRVASARFLEDSPRRVTLLNLGAPHPRQDLTVVIPGESRTAFGRPEETWTGRRACVTGAVELHRGSPQVILTDPARIRPDGY